MNCIHCESGKIELGNESFRIDPSFRFDPKPSTHFIRDLIIFSSDRFPIVSSCDCKCHNQLEQLNFWANFWQGRNALASGIDLRDKKTGKWISPESALSAILKEYLSPRGYRLTGVAEILGDGQCAVFFRGGHIEVYEPSDQSA